MRELELLQHIYRSNPKLPVDVTIPPGDDMGAVMLGDRTLLVAVDQVADGVHFDLASTPINKIGRKAITRNLSDVAAMAAKPVGAVAAACLPRDFGEDRAKALFDALRTTAEQEGCPLIGGDISFWNQGLIITVTVFAEPWGRPPVLRSGARVGDAVYVTGQLGGSMEVQKERGGYVHHLDFRPRIGIANILASNPASPLHAMIDLSDGLGKDLPRICEQSDVRAEIEIDRIPASDAARQAAAVSGQPAWRHALGDGEDYELCFTAEDGLYDRDNFEGVPVTRIGRIIPDGPGPRVTALQPSGTKIDISEFGWEHTG